MGAPRRADRIELDARSSYKASRETGGGGVVRTVLACLAALGASVAVAAPAPRLPVEAFAAVPSIDGPILSPNGERLAAKLSIGGEQVFAIHELYDGKKPTRLRLGDANELNWWRWVNDDWLVAGVGALDSFEGIELYVTRLVAIDRAGKVVPIRWRSGAQLGDQVVWTANDGTPHVLLAASDTLYINMPGYYPAVLWVDLPTGRTRSYAPSRAGVRSWMADRAGRIRLGLGYDRDRDRNLTVFRPVGGGATRVTALPDEHAPQVLYDGRDTMLVLADRDGREALWEFDLAKGEVGAKFHGAPDADLGSTFEFPDRDGPAGVWVLADRPRRHWFDADMAAAQAALDKAVAPALAEIVSWSKDRRKLLVRRTAGAAPGDLYFFDRDDGAMQRVGSESEPLRAAKLAPMRPISYRARDGLTIPGYLTLPVGGPEKGLPLIVMPHGGPTARDHLGYDHWVQFLANRGYAVLQPNYRGSTGLGRAHLEAGDGEWGLKMQDDVTDGVRWLAAEGTIDLKRVCIMGGSYGGYAAMQGIVRDPDLYRCAISFAGVSDLAAMARFDRNFLYGLRWNKRTKEKAPDFRAVSPARAAASVKTPLLLVHGRRDLRVPESQSRAMANALKAAGKPVEYVEQPLGDHNLSRQADRLQFLRAVEAFLARHNPA